MILPKSVDVFGIKYKVKMEVIEGLAGQCDRVNCILTINPELSEVEQFQTLLHEIGHAVFSRIGLIQAISPELEEVIVESLATAFSENFDLIDIS